jgi:hypothetical protein
MNTLLSAKVADILIESGTNIKAGTSEITEEEAIEIINLVAHIPISRESACVVLNVNNTKFYELLANKQIPSGRKRRGFKELVWYRDEIQKSIANFRK